MSKQGLEVESRKKIYKLIEEYPGLHMREISRRTGMALNLVKYHLDQLKRYEMLDEIEENEYKRYFPREGERRVDYRDKRHLALLRQEIPLSIVVYLLNEEKAVSHRELKDELDIAPSTLSYHLKKMEKKGLLEKDGRKYRVREPKMISDLLMKYEPPRDIIDNFIDLWESLSLSMIFL